MITASRLVALCLLGTGCATSPSPIILPAFQETVTVEPVSAAAHFSAPLRDQDQQQNDVEVVVDEHPDLDTRLILSTGITANPTTFLLSAQLDLPTGRSALVAPLLQIGMSNDETLIGLSVNVKREVELAIETSEATVYVYPHAQIGLGAVYLEEDAGSGSRDDFGVLVNIGTGFRVAIDDQVSVGTSILFNFVPGQVLGEWHFFTWQIAQFSYRF